MKPEKRPLAMEAPLVSVSMWVTDDHTNIRRFMLIRGLARAGSVDLRLLSRRLFLVSSRDTCSTFFLWLHFKLRAKYCMQSCQETARDLFMKYDAHVLFDYYI